jgi:hypothetical protein
MASHNDGKEKQKNKTLFARSGERVIERSKDRVSKSTSDINEGALLQMIVPNSTPSSSFL